MAIPEVYPSLTFQGHLSVWIPQGGRLRSHPFRVDHMDYISHGFSVYNTTNQTSANRAKTLFYASSGLLVGTVDHAFALNIGMWTDVKLEAIAVPATAVTAVLELYSTSGQYWATKIKSEEGEIATPYAANVSTYLTWLTPRGIYTGNLTANQITVASAETLANRLVTISNQYVNLSDTSSSYGSRLTSIEAGQITLSNTSANHSSRLTTIEAGQITLTTGLSGANSNISSLQGTTGGHATAITTLQAGQITLTTGLSGANSDISSLQGTVSGHTTSITSLQAGNLTINTNTSGALAGMTLTSDRLEFTGSGSYFRLMSKAGFDFIRAGSSSSAITFGVSPAGKLIASGAEISGAITATSGKIGGWNISGTYIDSTNGSARFYLASNADASSNYIYISNSSGTPVFTVSKQGVLTATGVTITGTHYGSLSSVTGSLNGVTGSYSGSSSGTHYGSLYQSGGSFYGGAYGGVYSSSGTLGGVSYSTWYSGVLGFSGQVRSTSGYQTASTISCGSGALGYASMYVNGNIEYTGFITDVSDIHYKQDVQPIEKKPLLEGIYGVDLVTFEPKSDPSTRKIGVIANDVVANQPKEFAKYFISTNSEGYLTASYTNLSLMGIAAIQDLNERLKAVEEKLA